MLNIVGKGLLAATSLSPVLGAVAVSEFERGEPWMNWAWWVAAAILLAVLCWLMLRYAAKKAQKSLFYIKDFERKDQEMLVFLFIYLFAVYSVGKPYICQ